MSDLEGVGDPHLLAVDDQVVARPPGGGLTGGHVAASSWLTDSKTSHGLQEELKTEFRAFFFLIKLHDYCWGKNPCFMDSVG